jgi:hypothetical protein
MKTLRILPLLLIITSEIYAQYIPGEEVERTIDFYSVCLHNTMRDLDKILTETLDSELIRKEANEKSLFKVYHNSSTQRITVVQYDFFPNYTYDRMCKRMTELFIFKEDIFNHMIEYFNNRSTFRKVEEFENSYEYLAQENPFLLQMGKKAYVTLTNLGFSTELNGYQLKVEIFM